LHLQRDAVIEMRVAVGGRVQQCLPERLFRRLPIAQRKLRVTQHAQEGYLARRSAGPPVPPPEPPDGLAPPPGPDTPQGQIVARASRALAGLMEEFEPDLVISDILTRAPALAAEVAGVPPATPIPPSPPAPRSPPCRSSTPTTTSAIIA